MTSFRRGTIPAPVRSGIYGVTADMLSGIEPRPIDLGPSGLLDIATASVDVLIEQFADLGRTAEVNPHCFALSIVAAPEIWIRLSPVGRAQLTAAAHTLEAQDPNPYHSEAAEGRVGVGTHKCRPWPLRQRLDSVSRVRGGAVLAEHLQTLRTLEGADARHLVVNAATCLTYLLRIKHPERSSATEEALAYCA